MAYRYGDDKNQMVFLPPSIEDYVSIDDPVRAYDAFVEALDLTKLGIEVNPSKVGNSSYAPKTMLKLLVYGYSYGETRSSRKLERALHHNLSFIWLTGNLKPDHKTIALFRRKNRTALARVLKECVRLCLKLDLIEGNTLFVDGTKIRANASIKNAWTKERCQETLEVTDRHIEELLNECEAIDASDEKQGSLTAMQEELSDKVKLKSKVNDILKELENQDKKAINTTDSECGRMNSLQGSHAGYNVQSVVDQKHGLIVSMDPVNENNDRNQFVKQIQQANETLGKLCLTACADAGYNTTDELEKLEEQGIKPIAPPNEKSENKKQFSYNADEDYYLCPQGHRLKYSGLSADQKSKIYRVTQKALCLSCDKFGTCTKSEYGKSVSRLIKEDIRLRFEEEYLKPESREIYKLRQQKAELPFGHIKRNLGVNAFLLRGLKGVRAETSILGTCFNLRRMMTLLGVTVLIAKLTV